MNLRSQRLSPLSGVSPTVPRCADPKQSPIVLSWLIELRRSLGVEECELSALRFGGVFRPCDPVP